MHCTFLIEFDNFFLNAFQWSYANIDSVLNYQLLKIFFVFKFKKTFILIVKNETIFYYKKTANRLKAFCKIILWYVYVDFVS